MRHPADRLFPEEIALEPEPRAGAATEPPVLIVGAGPVGLALANDLGLRGVACRIVEREARPLRLPKMNHVNRRSMELCRRWGLAEAVRRAGWPEDHPLDVAYVTSLAGHELARFPFPSQRELRPSAIGPEPPQRCPQIWFDPLLEKALARFPHVELLRGTELVDLRTHETGVEAVVEEVETGVRRALRARYLVGADGAGSRVREMAGIERESWGPAPRQMAIALRARDFWSFHDKRRAAFYWVLDSEGPRGLVTPTDGETLWRFNWNLRPDERAEDFDARAAVHRLAGAPFDHEIVTVLPWQIRFTLARRYTAGRIFLAGDAARTLSPTGGLGMNTGLADAADLGWKLAACLEGWGGELLLESYDAERRPAGRRINEESLRNLGRVAGLPRIAGLEADDARGRQRRAEAHRILMEGDFRLEWENDGAVLGTCYDDSPVICPEASTPRVDPNHYEPFCATGCRAPHLPLGDGRSTLDLFGAGFCLLRIGERPPAAGPLLEAAARRGLPLVVRELESPEAAALYERALVLVRPDGIVAWRGDALPQDSGSLVDRVRGAGARAPSRA